MFVFISKNPFPDRIEISDNLKNQSISTEKPFQLVFYDGLVTMKIFKQFYLKNKDVYFVVKNFEKFIFKMRIFRNLNFKIVQSSNKDEKLDANGGDVSRFDRLFGWNDGFERDKNVLNSILRYEKLEIKIKSLSETDDKNDRVNDRGVQISFCPRIFDSISASLLFPKLYLSEDMPCHVIYRLLTDGHKTLKELEKYTGKNIENTIKSMLFSGIIEKKGKCFSIIKSNM
jgi:hypothetical protein